MSTRSRLKYDTLSTSDRCNEMESQNTRFSTSDGATASLDQNAEPTQPNLTAKNVQSAPSLSASEHDYSTEADGSTIPPKELTVGWQTVTLLFGNYTIAFLVAMLHLVMMHYLNGKPADDREYLTQQHVTWLSLLLVTAFKASLCACMAVAFTQHMWKILRRKALRVSSIESLHGVRHNPLLFGKWRVFMATPILYLMAMVIWLVTVAILFPPSALTVVLRPFNETQSLLVPTFDAEYGRGIYNLAGTSSLSMWQLSQRTDEYSPTMTYLKPNAKLVHLAHTVLVSVAVPESASPCTADCDFTVNFEGPMFQCNTTVYNQTSEAHGEEYNLYYRSGWKSQLEHRLMYVNFDIFTMNTTVFLGTAKDFEQRLELRERHDLQCEAVSATYQVHFTYINGSRSFTYDAVPGKKLSDTFVKGASPDQHADHELWNATTIRNLRNINLYGLLDSVATTLAGSYNRFYTFNLNSSPFPYTMPDGRIVDFVNVEFSNFVEDDYLEPNKTWIRDTVFNKDRNNPTSDGPSLSITEDLLNRVVANVTIATMLGLYPLSAWNTTVQATTTTYRNTFSFSHPMALILPYSLSLAVSLPFLILGYLSLRINGVSALNDSFLQLLTTITRSDELDRIVRPCSLGGDEMATAELRSTRIMYGRLIAEDEKEGGGGRISGRMGFGLEGEIQGVRSRQKA